MKKYYQVLEIARELKNRLFGDFTRMLILTKRWKYFDCIIFEPEYCCLYFKVIPRPWNLKQWEWWWNLKQWEW